MHTFKNSIPLGIQATLLCMCLLVSILGTSQGVETLPCCTRNVDNYLVDCDNCAEHMYVLWLIIYVLAVCLHSSAL